MEATDRKAATASAGLDDLGVDNSLLYESFTDAVAHCAAGAYLATRAFLQSWASPVVVDTVKRTSKTVIVSAVCHYLLLRVILWPLGLLFKLINLATLHTLRLDAGDLVKSSMAIYPLLTVLLIKSVYRSSMDECFRHTLEQLDPKYAAHLAAKPRRFKPTMTDRLLQRLGMAGEDSDDLKTVLLLMVAGVLLRGWSSLPYVGWLLTPVIRFLSIRYMVGRPYAAAVFSIFAAIHPGLERPVLVIVELWASSKVLGRSSMKYFMDRMVPKSKKASFIRAFEYTVVSYFLLPTGLMRLPVLGSLMAFPAASMGAYALKDILNRKSGIADVLEHL